MIFTDLRQAVHEHPELVKQYFMTEVVKPNHNKFTALHAALWDSGAFHLRAQKYEGGFAAAGDSEPDGVQVPAATIILSWWLKKAQR